jgi:hypothetical protein
MVVWLLVNNNDIVMVAYGSLAGAATDICTGTMNSY